MKTNQITVRTEDKAYIIKALEYGSRKAFVAAVCKHNHTRQEVLERPPGFATADEVDGMIEMTLLCGGDSPEEIMQGRQYATFWATCLMMKMAMGDLYLFEEEIIDFGKLYLEIYKAW